jgi:two-component system, NtrC family, nitrogen regulation response regulator GlnG
MITSEIATTAEKTACLHDNPWVLVVDDEPLIRWSIAEALRDAGLAVHEAGDAASARRLLADAGLLIDVVLLDLHLPDCADLSLLDEALRLRPACHVVLMTAHGTPERQAEALAHGACAVMGKPFDIDTLEPLVRHAVEQPRLDVQD